MQNGAGLPTLAYYLTRCSKRRAAAGQREQVSDDEDLARPGGARPPPQAPLPTGSNPTYKALPFILRDGQASTRFGAAPWQMWKRMFFVPR